MTIANFQISGNMPYFNDELKTMVSGFQMKSAASLISLVEILSGPVVEILFEIRGPCHLRPGPLLRNHDLGGKFQKGDLIFYTRNISLYELLRKTCISHKA